MFGNRKRLIPAAFLLLFALAPASAQQHAPVPPGTPAPVPVDEVLPLSRILRNFPDVSEGSFAQIESEAAMQADVSPAYKSCKVESKVFIGCFVPASPNTRLAVFSDDGCNVSVDGALVYNGFGAPQHLPSLNQSLHKVNAPAWVPGRVYRIEVEYSNIIYTPAPGMPDIDGVTLFAYNGGGEVVPEVTETKWVELTEGGQGVGNFELNGNPPGDERSNPPGNGGGDRIFPEKKTPTGPLLDRIKVQAKLSAPVPVGRSVVVWFRIMDPDHYSGNEVFNINGPKKPDDNVRARRASDGNEDVKAIVDDTGARFVRENGVALEGFQVARVRIVGDGMADKAEIPMRITARQPGNNWIVVTGCCEDCVLAITFDADGKTPLSKKKADGGAPLPLPGPRTPMLTCWRTINFDLDQMGAPVLAVPQPAPPAKPVPTSVVPAGNIVGKNIRGAVADLEIDVPLNWPGVVENVVGGGVPVGQFQGGTIVIPAIGAAPIDVLGNTAGPAPNGQRAKVTVPSAAVAAINPTIRAPVAFQGLADDDCVTMGAGAMLQTNWKRAPADIAVNTNQMDEKYRPACVRIKTNTITGPARPPVAFQLHVGERSGAQALTTAARALIGPRKRAQSENDFWVVYALGAFQPNWAHDRDPASEGSVISGVSTGFATTNAAGERTAGILIFAEVVRDASAEAGVRAFNDLAGIIAVHESGHEFGLPHGHGGIMADAEHAEFLQANSAAPVFAPASLRAIMLKNRPGIKDLP